jgi:hypothetical protein
MDARADLLRPLFYCCTSPLKKDSTTLAQNGGTRVA